MIRQILFPNPFYELQLPFISGITNLHPTQPRTNVTLRDILIPALSFFKKGRGL